MGAIKNLNSSLLGFKLRPISIKELALHIVAPGDLYRFEGSQYVLTFKERKRIDRDHLKTFLTQGHTLLYASEETISKLNRHFKEMFLKTARSLSIGDPSQKGKKQISYLSVSLNILYNDPLSDDSLNLHFKGSQNLGNFLVQNKNLPAKLYKDLKKFHHHYIISQPLLSSLLTIGFFDYLRVFQDKELENFFLTSMFKDIGMSFIPKEKYEIKNPNADEKKVFKGHSDSSKKILDGRLSLARNYLEIIENHHFLSEKVEKLRAGESLSNLKHSENITGIETYVVAVMDIIVAMIEGRPYQDKHSLFEALDLVKKLMEKEYPTEFKALVLYLRKFFS